MRALVLLLAMTSPCWGAWTAQTGVCTAQSKSANTSLACTVATANMAAGSITALCWAGDNTATVDGNDQLLTGVSDSKGNPWTLPRCFTNGQGSAGTGATACISFGTINRILTSATDTITTTYSSITAKGFTTKNFTITAGNGIKLIGTPADVANDGADPGSLNDTSVASAEHLWFRCTALERPTASTWTVTTNFTTVACNGTTSGTATNMDACAEFRIFTGTTNASDPTGTSVDNASTYRVVDEIAPVSRMDRFSISQLGRRVWEGLFVSPAQAMGVGR